MNKEEMKFTHIQVMDNEETKYVRDVLGEHLANGEQIYEYYEDDKLYLLRILPYDEGILVRLIADGYQANIPLELNEMTEGKYVMMGKIMQFNFFLKKIDRKGLAIYLEYDIFHKGSVISNNTWRIEVK